MSAGGSTFLFVNKTQNSTQLTRSVSSERCKIFSHVQGHGEANKSRVSFQPTKPNDRQFNSPDDSIRSRKPRGRPRKKIDQTGRCNAPLTKNAERARPDSLPSPQTLIDRDGDPFDVQNVSVSPAVQYILRIYSSDIIPLLCPTESLAESSRKYTLSLAFEDPLVQHSLLSLVWTRLGSRSSHNSYRILAMASKNKALNHLRRLLLDFKGERIRTSHCFAIALLIWIECLTGNPEEVVAHNRGLQSLLPRAEDVQSAHVYILRLIYACLYLCTAMLDVPPATQTPRNVDETTLPPGVKLAMKELRKPNYIGHGYAFFLPPNSDILGPALTPIGRELQQLVALRKLCANADQSEAAVRCVCVKELAIERELLAIRFSHTFSPSQDAVRLAMFIYSALPLIAATGTSAALSKTLARQIRRDLEDTALSSCWEAASSLLLWILLIGSFTCQGEDEEAWFQDQICRVLGHLGVQSSVEMRAKLRGYYDSRYLNGTIAAAWDEYESRVWLRVVGNLPILSSIDTAA